ncbi:MAG: hypothetical protein LBQ28_05750 [Prevotellaceae bacterium]|jgi:ligand-binding sensor domain-containing protein|nr:hypothetical protein [Prevotellaceae bacterium]
MTKKHIILLFSLLLVVATHSPTQPSVSKHLGVEDGLSNNYVTHLAQDGQGRIWIATESGLSRFDGKNFTTYRENNSGLISNALNALLYDRDEDALWIGTKAGIGIFRCSTHQFENYTITDGVEINNVVHLSPAAAVYGLRIIMAE